MENQAPSQLEQAEQLVYEIVFSETMFQLGIDVVARKGSHVSIPTLTTTIIDAIEDGFIPRDLDALFRAFDACCQEYEYFRIMNALLEKGAIEKSKDELEALVNGELLEQHKRLSALTIVAGLVERGEVTYEESVRLIPWFDEVRYIDGYRMLVETWIKSGDDAIGEDLIQEWMDEITSNIARFESGPGADYSPRWDRFCEIAVLVLSGRQVGNDGKVVKQAISGITLSQEDDRVMQWLTQMPHTEENDDALRLIIEAFEKKVERFDIELVKAGVEFYLDPEVSGLPYQVLAKRHAEVAEGLNRVAYVIEKFGEFLDAREVERWLELGSSGQAYLNSSAIPIAILSHPTLSTHFDSSQSISWIENSITLAKQKEQWLFLLSAAKIAAFLISSGEDRITLDQAGSWIDKIRHHSTRHFSAPIELALIHRKEVFGITHDHVRSWVEDPLKVQGNAEANSKFRKPSWTVDVCIAAIEHGLADEDDIRLWIKRAARFDPKYLDDRVRLITAVIRSDSHTFSTEEVQGWVEALRQCSPPSALKIGYLARDEGIPLADEDLEKWLMACFSGVSAQELVCNAVTVAQQHRNRLRTTAISPDIKANSLKLADEWLDRITLGKKPLGIGADSDPIEVRAAISAIALDHSATT